VEARDKECWWVYRKELNMIRAWKNYMILVALRHLWIIAGENDDIKGKAHTITIHTL